MAFTKDERALLKIVVQKELEALEQDGAQLFISNSPFITKVSLDAPDIPFLKSAAKYQAFLKKLQKKL